MNEIDINKQKNIEDSSRESKRKEYVKPGIAEEEVFTTYSLACADKEPVCGVLIDIS